jgi:hypothetical protein
MDVPKNADPGTHYGVLLVSTAPVSQAAGPAVQTKIGPIILVKVGGAVKERFTLESFSAPTFLDSPSMSFAARFRNEGTVHLAPAGDIEVRNMLGWLVATGTLPQRNVLPGAVRSIETSVGAEGVWLGRYAVSLRSTYGQLRVLGVDPLLERIALRNATAYARERGSLRFGLVVEQSCGRGI